MKKIFILCLLAFIGIKQANAQTAQLISGVESISSFYISSSGTLYGWGAAYYGQLFDGISGTNVYNPKKIGTTSNWATVASGQTFSVAVKTDGTLWACGQNASGQLGDGTTVDKPIPIQIGTATNWAKVFCGETHTVAIKTDGTLWAWGNNNHGQLGDGTIVNKKTPTQVGTATDWKTVACGAFHTMAIKSDNTLWGCGYNVFGMLGLGTNTTNEPLLKKVGSASDWLSISCGIYFCCAIKTDGTLWSWGYNGDGQLGNGTKINVNIPTQIGTNTNWSAISCGIAHTVAAKNNGTLWTCGWNSSGQLGDGNTISKSSLQQIGTDNDWAIATAGGYHTLCMKTNGTLWACGFNSAGSLGDGTTGSKTTLIQIQLSANKLPSFTGTGVKLLNICQNSLKSSIQNNMTVADADTGQTETYRITSNPAHGTIITGGSATSNGSIVSPTGWYYTPTSGYNGSDSFTIQVDDGNGGIASNTVTVIVKATSTSTTNIGICPSALPYSWNGLTFNTAGSQTYYTTNSVGCDSAATLNLTIKATSASTANISICPSALPYTWNGLTFNAAGSQTFHTTNAAGCDSAATLNLTIKATSASTTNISICSSALPYTWNGLTFNTAGTQTAHLNNSVNCDSAATLNLTVKQATTSTTNKAYCQSELPASWNGLTITAVGTFIAHLTNAAGCDSAATLVASVKTGAVSNTNYATAANVTTVSMCSIGDVFSIANYTAPNGKWTSSDNNVVTVSPIASFNRVASIKAIGFGTATVTYSGIISAGGCPGIISSVVTVSTQAAPGAITGSTTACVNTGTAYTSTPAGGVWTGVRGTFASNIFTPTSAGSGSITYTLTNAAGCSASVSKAVTINTQPAVPTIAFAAGTTGITGSGGYCKNKTFTLVGTPTGGSWAATGAFSTTSGGVVTSAGAAGAASVTYTITNANGCSNSRTQTAAVTAACKGISSQQSSMDSRQVTIYPNPAHTVINLKVDKLIGTGSIVVTDLYGKQLKQQALSMGANTIDVSGFAKGMYLISVITESGKQTQKVVVE